MKIIIIFIVLFFVVTFFFMQSFCKVVVVTEGDNGSENSLLYWKIITKDDFVIHSFRHSLHKVNQKDFYVPGSSNEMILIRVEFGSLDAAMYYDDNIIYEHSSDEFSDFAVYPDFKLNNLLIRVGRISDQKLLVRNDIIELTSLVEVGGLLNVEILSVLDFLLIIFGGYKDEIFSHHFVFCFSC